MGRVLQPKRDKYYNTQKNLCPIKKVIKHPTTEHLLQSLGNSNFSLPRPPLITSSSDKLQADNSLPPPSTSTPKHQDVLHTVQKKHATNTLSRFAHAVLGEDSAGSVHSLKDSPAPSPPLYVEHSLPDNPNDRHTDQLQNTQHQYLSQREGALSSQLEAADKAVLATDALQSFMSSVARREVQNGSSEGCYINNKMTGNGVMSEYFMTAGRNYMDIAQKYFSMASEFNEKGL